MPDIVAHGRKPDVLACGYCHRADGPGGPENASLAGLPYSYIVQQMSYYKSGRRSTALPHRLPQALMMALAKAATEEEIREAAEYFSSLKPRQNIRVVETGRVPKTYVANWFLAAREGKESEPLGERIVETPENLERFESRDARATFVAYVPTGSKNRESVVVYHLSRQGPQRSKRGAVDRWSFTELRGKAVVRHPDWGQGRKGCGAHEGTDCKAKLGRHDFRCRISCVIETLTPVVDAILE
jgi:cytochrome c553